MKKIVIVLVAMFLLIAVALGGYYIWLKKPENRTSSYVVPKILEPFVRIERNNELNSENFSFNGDNKEMYYYFDIYNYDENEEEFSTLAVTPYVRIAIEQNKDINNEALNLVSVNLYYLKDLSLGLEEGNFEELTTQGEEGSGYEDYFMCKRLLSYDKEKPEQNVAHYVAKLTLNTENESYNNLTQNITQKLEIVLGYRK